MGENSYSQQEIVSSIAQYGPTILNDINLVVRLSYENRKDGTTHTYHTRLVTIENDKVIFNCPTEQLEWVNWVTGTMLEIHFVSRSALFTTYVAVEKRLLKNEIMYYAGRILAPLEKRQQRKHFRLYTSVKIQFYRINELEDVSSENTFLPQDEESITLLVGETTNISAGGMSFVTKEPFEKDDQLCLFFSLQNHSLQVTGRVLEPGEKVPAGMYRHRIQFVTIDRKTENLLSKAIMEKQREALANTYSKQPLYQKNNT